MICGRTKDSIVICTKIFKNVTEESCIECINFYFLKLLLIIQSVLKSVTCGPFVLLNETPYIYFDIYYSWLIAN